MQTGDVRSLTKQILTIVGLSIGVGLWLTVVWAVYVLLPHYRKLFEELGTKTSTITRYVLSTSGVLLPILIVVAAAILVFHRKSGTRLCVVLLLPMVLIALLVLAIGPAVQSIVNDLTSQV